MPIKITFQKETQKLSKIPSSFSQFVSKMESSFKGKLPQKYVLEYENKIGERVGITNDKEYKSMLDNEMPHQLVSVKVYVLTEQESFEEKEHNRLIKQFANGSSTNLSKEGMATGCEHKTSEEVETENVPGLLSLFNNLITDKLSHLEHISSTTEKNSKETKITINFKRKDEKRGTSKVELMTKLEEDKHEGHYQWGDLPKKITKAKKKSDTYIIEWNKRKNGEQPSKTEMKATEIMKYDANFLQRLDKVTSVEPLNIKSPIIISVRSIKLLINHSRQFL